jgi:hypothetical protein
MSPAGPSHSLTPDLCLSPSSDSSRPSSRGSLLGSPRFFRNFRILSASPALISPSLLPSTASQSSAAATSIGLTYSWKWSRAGTSPSAGGAETYRVSFRGSCWASNGSCAMCSTTFAHFFCMRFFSRRSYMTAAVHDPVMDRNIIQLREGSLMRMFGKPRVVRCEFACEMIAMRTHHPPYRIWGLCRLAGPCRRAAAWGSFYVRLRHAECWLWCLWTGACPCPKISPGSGTAGVVRSRLRLCSRPTLAAPRSITICDSFLFSWSKSLDRFDLFYCSSFYTEKVLSIAKPLRISSLVLFLQNNVNTNDCARKLVKIGLAFITSI